MSSKSPSVNFFGAGKLQACLLTEDLFQVDFGCVERKRVGSQRCCTMFLGKDHLFLRARFGQMRQEHKVELCRFSNEVSSTPILDMLNFKENEFDFKKNKLRKNELKFEAFLREMGDSWGSEVERKS